MAHLIGCEHRTDCFLEPIWLYRVLPTLALLALILAQTVAANHDILRDTLEGTSTGLLLAVCVFAFSAKPLRTRKPKPASAVQRYPVT